MKTAGALRKLSEEKTYKLFWQLRKAEKILTRRKLTQSLWWALLGAMKENILPKYRALRALAASL